MHLNIDTRCIHLEDSDPLEHFGAIRYPIYQTATFAHPGVGKSTGYDYSRSQNPTRETLEKIVASLENGTDAIAFSSGMAATAALMEIFQPGDHILIESDLYGGTIRLFHQISEKNGIHFTDINFSTEDIEAQLQKNTKALYIETPTNPMMHVTDLEKVSRLAKKKGILTIVDNTFLSPYFQNPLDLGADIVLHSGTKYLGGHNDTIAGFLVVKDEILAEKFRMLIQTVGSNLSPFDSFLIQRGIQTLAVRMEKAQKNTIEIAKWLQQRNDIKRVIYPGLPEHPGYEIIKRQARGFGAMLSFEVEKENMAKKLLNHLKLIRFAESLGGTETLMTYPIMQTHAEVPKELLEKNGITDCILRLSVGIENVEDIITDLGQALDKAANS